MAYLFFSASPKLHVLDGEVQWNMRFLLHMALKHLNIFLEQVLIQTSLLLAKKNSATTKRITSWWNFNPEPKNFDLQLIKIVFVKAPFENFQLLPPPFSLKTHGKRY